MMAIDEAKRPGDGRADRLHRDVDRPDKTNAHSPIDQRNSDPAARAKTQRFSAAC
jgi:hypothetical protein